MERYLIGILALLLLATFGVFLWFVPIIPLLASVLVMLGLVLAFSLGIYIGTKPTQDDGGSTGEPFATSRLV